MFKARQIIGAVLLVFIGFLYIMSVNDVSISANAVKYLVIALAIISILFFLFSAIVVIRKILSAKDSYKKFELQDIIDIAVVSVGIFGTAFFTQLIVIDKSSIIIPSILTVMFWITIFSANAIKHR